VKRHVPHRAGLRVLVQDSFCPNLQHPTAICSGPVVHKEETLINLRIMTLKVAHVRTPRVRTARHARRLDLEYSANAQEAGREKLAQSDTVQRKMATAFEATAETRIQGL